MTKTEQYLRKIIRVRKHLESTGKGCYNVNANLSHLEKLLDYNKYSSERLIAKFFIRKRSMIFSLLPGVNCKAHKKLTDEYQQHYFNSLKILEHDTIPG